MSKEREIARALIERAHANADCAEDDLVNALQATRRAALEEAAKACAWVEDSLMEDAYAARQALDFDKRNEMEAQSFGAEKAKNAVRTLAQGGGK